MHLEYTGGDHASVGVEFEKTGDFKHNQKSKEVQVLEIDTGMDHETFNITVKKAMGGKFQMMFVNPKYNKDVKNSKRTVTSREVKDNDSAHNIRRALCDFYCSNQIWGSNVEVKKYETNDKFETVESGSTQIVYTVKVLKAIDGDGFTSATVLKKKGTTSDIAMSALLTKSSPPLSGKFNIVCKNSDNTEFSSRDFNWNEWTDALSLYLSWDIPHLMLKTHIY